MNTASWLGCALVVALVAPSPAADTLRVPKDFATLQDAVDAAQAGDSVLASKGTYAPFTVDSRSDLTIKGRGKPILDGGGADVGVTIQDSVDITLDGFVIQNTSDAGIVVTDSTSITIRKCRVVDVPDGIWARNSSGIVVERCHLDDCGNGIDFSDNGEGPMTDSTIRRNRITEGEEGMDLGGSGHLVEKNKLLDTGGEAISLDEDATAITITKNKMINTDGAITLRGSGHVVEKNKVKDSRNEGISVVASNCRVEKNKLNGIDDDAIDLEGDDNEILFNKIRNAESNGIEVNTASGEPFPVTGNLIEGNRISKSDENGIKVQTGGNTFRKNKARQSGDFDLLDEAGEGANVYEDNAFGTVEIED